PSNLGSVTGPSGTVLSRDTDAVAAGVFLLAARLEPAAFLVFDGLVFVAAMPPRGAARETGAGCLATRGRPVCSTRSISVSTGTATYVRRSSRCRADNT